MSRLVFDGTAHTVQLIDKHGKAVGTWTAYNNIDSAFAKTHYAGARHLKNGLYVMQDSRSAHRHPGDNANGRFGTYGILRFNYHVDHPGVGVHSGRANNTRVPGAQHATHGCVRTTDEAMRYITAHISGDPLTNITIQGNSQAAAQHGARVCAHR